MIAPPAIHFQVPSVPSPAPLESRFLAIIAAVEGHSPHDLGGVYGLKAITWRQHSRLPYSASRNPAAALHVARLHFRWLERSLHGAGYAPTVYRIAAAWRFGLEGGIATMQRHRVDYADRTENLYYGTPMP